MTRKKTFWIVFGGAGVLGALLLAVAVYKAGPILDYLCTKKSAVATVDAHNRRSIVFTADTCFENDTRPLYYEVREAGRVVTPTFFVGNDNGNESHRYTAFFAEGDSLLAVLETTATPPRIVVMQDFNAGESWPRLHDREVITQVAVKEKWERIFDRLARENPQLPKPKVFNH